MTRKSTQRSKFVENTVAEIIRVNHAGEFGAKRIYEGQLAVLGKHKQIQEMQKQELSHLGYFDDEMKKRQVRPTVFHPIWNIAAFGLGAATALLGEKAAMACTVAVESVIEKHYMSQIETLEIITGEDDLKEQITKFRKEEMDHHDTALAYGLEDSVPHQSLIKIVSGITKIAIALSKKL